MVLPVFPIHLADGVLKRKSQLQILVIKFRDTESETKILLQGERCSLDPNPRRPRTVLGRES